MSIFHRKPLLTIGLLVILLLGLPITVFLFQQQQETRSQAEQTVTLSFSPTTSDLTPLVVPAGSNFALDVMINPGANKVSLVKAEILYDDTKFAVAPGVPFQPNQNAFPQLLEGPSFSAGKVAFTLSVGTDVSRAITQQTRIATIQFRALDGASTDELTTQVRFGPATQALSLSSSTSPTENVLANTIPAIVYVGSPASTVSTPATPTPSPIVTLEPTPNFSLCPNAPSDTMIVIDRSGSMNDKIGTSATKIGNTRTAAKNFVDILAGQAGNKAGLATFATTASLDSALTTDYSSLKTKIDAISANGWTCIECAINKANQEIASHGRQEAKHVVVLLTDGRATTIEGSTKTVSTAIAEQKALDAAKAGNAASDTIFYTIGVGNDVNGNFLQSIATATGGKYYFSPTSNDLNTIYTAISKVAAKGSVSGSVFNDADGDGIFDAAEQKLSGWSVQLSREGSGAQSFTTSAEGTYAITGLCDGKYTLKEQVQSGWKQTLPTNNGSYTITIDKGTVITDKLFGNKKITRCSDGMDNDTNGFIDEKDSTCHTDGNPKNSNSYDPNKDGEHGGNTCADSKDNNGNDLIDGADPICHENGDLTKPWIPTLPEAEKKITLSLDILLHGIGSAGDNTNPTASSLSNKNPHHPERTASVLLYNAQNALVATGAGVVKYSSASGKFNGAVTLTDPIPNGVYTIKVGVEKHLVKLIAGIQTLTQGETKNLPITELVTGDSTKDNKLDIRDYNLLLDCYSDLSAAPACNPIKKVDADINDDGAVNQVDYNLFLREISTQPGE